MRKFTSREIDEITEVFKATLEACTSKTARSKTSGSVVQIEGDEVDLNSLPTGTALVCDSGIAYRTSQGWFGTLLWDDNVSSGVIASELAEDPSVKFLYNPSRSYPTGSVEIGGKREWTKSVLTNGVIKLDSGSLDLSPDSLGSGCVFRINGSFTYLLPPENIIYSQDGKRFYTIDDFSDDVVSKFRFPFSLEVFSR
nr:MAG TPA: hypothetical protein [Caudoviricetes sp.]